MTKTFYFVRHGETPFNKLQRHQYPEDHLNDRGREQAQAAARALEGKGIELVIASDLVRTSETGSIIAKHLGVDILYTPILHEVRRPTKLWGKSHYSLASLLFFIPYFIFSVIGNKRFANEETLRDFAARVGRALDMLETRPEQKVVVVTHRGVMTILAAIIRARGKIHPVSLILAFLGMYAVDNAEITTATYGDGGWQLAAKNDNKHLQSL